MLPTRRDTRRAVQPEKVTRGLKIPIKEEGEFHYITKTSPCNEDPLTPHFYIVKLGFTGVYIFSYFCFKT